MAREVRHFTATIPAGTPIAAPATVAIAMPPRIVRSIYWRVPNGPMGNFGWRITMGKVQVIPSAGDLFVVANDEHGTWEVHDFPDSGAWEVTGYNTGANPHSVYLAFHVDLPERPAQLRAPLDFTAPPFMPDLSRSRIPPATRP